jgi:hypothetical protein
MSYRQAGQALVRPPSLRIRPAASIRRNVLPALHPLGLLGSTVLDTRRQVRLHRFPLVAASRHTFTMLYPYRQASANPLSVVPIFATPFGVMQLPEAQKLNEPLAGLLAARALADSAVAVTGAGSLCYRSADELLEWTDEPAQIVCAEILRGIWSVIASINSFTEEELKSLSMQARGWFTIVHPDGCLPVTTYPLTSWCGMYCVESPQPCADRRDSGVLRLHETRLGTMFSDATNAAPHIPYTPGHYTWRPVPGQMAVFPASIRHEIAMVRSPGRLMLVTVRARFVAPGQEGVSRW